MMEEIKAKAMKDHPYCTIVKTHTDKYQPKYSNYSCKYHSCTNKQYCGSIEKHFFQFPRKDPTLQLAWMKFCGLTELPTSTGYRLCEDHFNENDFYNSSHKKLLKEAIPSKPSNGVPQINAITQDCYHQEDPMNNHTIVEEIVSEALGILREYEEMPSKPANVSQLNSGCQDSGHQEETMNNPIIVEETETETIMTLEKTESNTLNVKKTNVKNFMVEADKPETFSIEEMRSNVLRDHSYHPQVCTVEENESNAFKDHSYCTIVKSGTESIDKYVRKRCNYSCKYPTCDNKQYRGSIGKHFFSFPLKNPTRQLAWMKFCGLTERPTSSGHRICEDHFNENDFYNSSHKKLLKGAIPSKPFKYVPKYSNYSCKYPSCANKQYCGSIEKHFFQFPQKDPTLQLAWMKFCGLTELPTSTGYRLCEDHFNEKDFYNSSHKRLLKEAIPSKPSKGVSEVNSVTQDIDHQEEPMNNETMVQEIVSEALRILKENKSNSLNVEETNAKSLMVEKNAPEALTIEEINSNVLRDHSYGPQTFTIGEIESNASRDHSYYTSGEPNTVSLDKYVPKCCNSNTNKQDCGSIEKHSFQIPHKDQTLHTAWMGFCGLAECQTSTNHHSHESSHEKLLKETISSKPANVVLQFNSGQEQEPMNNQTIVEVTETEAIETEKTKSNTLNVKNTDAKNHMVEADQLETFLGEEVRSNVLKDHCHDPQIRTVELNKLSAVSLDEYVPKRCNYSCKYPTCNNKQYRGSIGKHFFSFPLKDPTLQLAWMKFCGLTKPPTSSGHRICEDHFNETDFYNSSHKKLLKEAIPSKPGDAVPKANSVARES